MLVHQEISLSDQLRAVTNFVKLTKNPSTFEAIYALDKVLKRTDLMAVSLQHLKTQPDVAALIQERYLAPAPDLNELLTYPEVSLGYQFAFHLVSNHFDPEFYRAFYRNQAISDDIAYVTLRRSQTHDIYHVITGFGTDPSGELGLQAFQLAQMLSPIAIAILTAGIINTFTDPQTLNVHMEQIFRGWQMGMKAKPLMAQKWEEHWEKSVAEWRTELGIGLEPAVFPASVPSD